MESACWEAPEREAVVALTNRRASTQGVEHPLQAWHQSGETGFCQGQSRTHPFQSALAMAEMHLCHYMHLLTLELACQGARALEVFEVPV